MQAVSETGRDFCEYLLKRNQRMYPLDCKQIADSRFDAPKLDKFTLADNHYIQLYLHYCQLQDSSFLLQDDQLQQKE